MNARTASGRRAGIDNALVDALVDFENSALSPPEKAAIRYTDEIYLDSHRVSSDVIERFERFFTGSKRIELSWAVGLWIEMGRMFHVLELPHEEDPAEGTSEEWAAKQPSSGNSRRHQTEHAQLTSKEAIAVTTQVGEGSAEFWSTLEAIPEVAPAFARFWVAMISEGALSEALKRRILARLGALYSGSADIQSSSAVHAKEFSETELDRESVAYGFLEAFERNYQDVPEETFGALSRTFTDQEIAELSLLIFVSAGLSRAGAALGYDVFGKSADR